MQNILDKIISGELQLKELSADRLERLCAEIRGFLIEHVSKTGGHLSSNLGTVELTVALHRVFTTPQDAIVFDVGHQCYTHKILTGARRALTACAVPGGCPASPTGRRAPTTPLSPGTATRRCRPPSASPGRKS